MKNVLAIEIKDNKTIVTLAKVERGNYSLILHKSYGSKPLSKSVSYDRDIVEAIYRDLRELNITNEIDETLLTINTIKTSVSTNTFGVSYNQSIDSFKEDFETYINTKYSNLNFSKIEYSTNEDIALTEKKVIATVEGTPNEYYNEIVDLYKQKGIKITKVVPTLDAIKNSVAKYADEHRSTISILVEEKFIQLTWINNNKITSAVKWSHGLTDIYEHISSTMGINKSDAKQLFKSFGSIPPEDVVDDKVIYTQREGKELNVFTKKDLSRMITEKVQDLFGNVKHHIDELKHNGRIKIVFNGEIKTLTGFKKFASKSFNEPDIKKYKSTIIGLNPETEFITMGMLLEVKTPLQNNKKRKEHLYIQKNNLLTRMFRMYSYT